MKTLEVEKNTGMAIDVIDATVDYLQKGGDAPKPKTVVAALLAVEKQRKQAKQRYSYEQMVGSWRLGFVSGTVTVRPRPQATPIKKTGNGRFLPRRLLEIKITYTPAEPLVDPKSAAETIGTWGHVENVVTVGPLYLCLSGPTRFWPNTNSLGFDFTHAHIKLGPLTMYQGGMRGGADRTQAFQTQTLKDQAFFTFFWVTPDAIAARGKGGGLALWVRAD